MIGVGPHRFDLAMRRGQLLQGTAACQLSIIPKRPESDIGHIQSIKIKKMTAAGGRACQHPGEVRFKQSSDFRAGQVVFYDLHGGFLCKPCRIDKTQNVIYKLQMIEIRRTENFDRWLRKLRDPNAKARIQIRIDRLARGLFGDVKDIGQGLSELRVDYGPGYRVYLMRRGDVLMILLCGGDKRTQDNDIKLAKMMAAEWKRSDS